jgi:pSer/pThr/pTyr-binding forkhead associated (FHA) protein
MRLSPRTTRHSVGHGAPPAGRYLRADDDTLVPVMGTVTRLGRSLSADIEIDETSVSRRHALIVRQDGQTYLLDDGSRNGTWHNGIRVDRAVLSDGDTIDLGTARLSYVVVTSHGGRRLADDGESVAPGSAAVTGGRNAHSPTDDLNLIAA